MAANTDSQRESSENNSVDGYVCASCGSEFDTTIDAKCDFWDSPENDENAWVLNGSGCYANGVIVYDSANGGIKRRHNMVCADRGDC